MATGEVRRSVRETADSIAEMEVRGATQIAEAAVTALADQATESDASDVEAFRAELRAAARHLYETRPTAVSLPNALRYVLGRVDGDDVAEVRDSVLGAAEEFGDRLERAQTDLGEVGASRLADGDTVMTHCHSTDVLACIETAVEDGTDVSAVVKETRPLRQGVDTARRLDELGVPVRFVVDSAAYRYLGDVDHVFVGADTITATGTVVNKIGTAGLAANAHERDVPVTVAAQTLKLDPETLVGSGVDIEHRADAEVLDAETRTELDVTVENPAFDETPRRYVDAIVTERGRYPPESIVTLVRDLYGPEPDRPWEE